MIYNLANNVTHSQVKTGAFFVYAHVSTAGIYIGMTKLLAKRWSGHYNSAFDSNDRDYGVPFKKAIRSGVQFEHYILAATATEREARDIEAFAIVKYSTLNVRPETVTKRFNMVDKIVSQGKISVVQELTDSKTYSSSDRTFAKARIVYEGGRLRVKTVGGDGFRSGLFIECSRAERNKFQVGDLVKVRAVLTTKPTGEYLSAMKGSPILRA